MLTKTFSVSGNQQEILARYKPFMVSSAQTDGDTSTARLVMRGQVGFFRLAPKLRVTAKTQARGEGTNVTLRVSPNFSYWFVLIVCALATACTLPTVYSGIMLGKTVHPLALLIPLAMVLLDVVELWGQAESCMDRLQRVAAGPDA